MSNQTFANRWNADLIDEKYRLWQEDPSSIEDQWQAFFEGFHLASTMSAGQPSGSPSEGSNLSEHAIKQARFTGAIFAYRSIGHTQADINPLMKEVVPNPRLTLERLGFSEAELDEVYWSGNYRDGVHMSVREILSQLKQTYCGSIGVEYLHIQETPQRRWLQARMEGSLNKPDFPVSKQCRILERIIKAEQFEHFLHSHYVGQKRFGLEGGETFIAALDALVEIAPSLGVKELVMGMAHRGRLNVLANVMRKSFEYIFHEFSENFVPDMRHGDGDVKYHLGFDAELKNSREESIMMRLAANPSHLEAVNPVVEGRARARQRLLEDTEERSAVVPILVHGDAAFAGQGIVAEVLNYSQLSGYRTGGTIHFVINNQIGFTTDPSESRSSHYCTDVAKMIEAPIFHVNGDDPEAVIWVTEMALAYRQEFHRDVVVDIICYRRQGHNEADEPAFTQPVLYRRIKDHPSVTNEYGERLLENGVITKDEWDQITEKRKSDLRRCYEEMRRKEKEGEEIIKAIDGANSTYQPDYAFKDIKTQVPRKELEHVAKALTRFPKDFNINPKIKRQLQTKLKAFENGEGVDWAFAESLAWGTLMMEGYHIRLSGQDSVRGTFSQRHAIFYDSKTREKYVPLLEMEDRKGMLCVHNSSLSEVGILGFDYGYSLDFPDMLCMWEAQFGDFVNGAQVLIDQFISSSESKWQRVSGLVMLLPHGYEGQGPEHSSARLERFLQACAEDNIQVANLTTPAQYFHILRRQMHRDFRKPLIIMSPKSLLRSKDATSSIEEFTDCGFRSILGDTDAPKNTKRVIFCSGKVYYDLMAYRRENKIKDTAIIRIEQFYPFNHQLCRDTFKPHSKATKIVWCQEEPQNMGGWQFINGLLEETLSKRPVYAGRGAAASTAVGSLTIHKQEQAELVKQAFTL
jgi:2-oxoglutarate dehydrogenase E1 component